MNTLDPYLHLLPEVIVAFFSALILAPIIGEIATRLGFLDLPANLRKRSDSTKDQRLHKETKPRLGSLAVLLPFILIILVRVTMTTQLWGMMIGLIILIVIGILDDKYELSGKTQFTFQFLAAAIVVVCGTSFSGISIAGFSLDFSAYATPIQIGNFVYNFVFPADLITIGWIMAIVNALNWVCGIDALGEGMTVIASVTMMVLSVRFGAGELALFPALLTAGVLGFLPYNYPPSKIIGGTVGHGYGFILAVMAVIISSVSESTGNGPKLTTAIIILSIPLVDMAWVLFNRMREYRTINIFKLFSISGRVHLHHRLMSLGFSVKQTLYIEISAMAVISVIAFYFAGFNTVFLVAVGVVTLLLVLFTVISTRSRLTPKRPQPPKDDPPTPIIDTGPTPEEKYAY